MRPPEAKFYALHGLYAPWSLGDLLWDREGNRGAVRGER